MAVAHLALDFGFGHHGSDRVHDDGIDSAGAHQCFADFHGLLTGIRLADQQAVNVYAQRGGVHGVQRMLNVDERDLAAHLLGFGQDVQSQRSFTRGFGAVDLDDTAAGHTADTQGQVQAQAAGGDGVDLHGDVGAQLHHGAFAKLFFDLRQGRFQRLLLVRGRAGGLGCRIFFCCHGFALLLSQKHNCKVVQGYYFPDAPIIHDFHAQYNCLLCFSSTLNRIFKRFSEKNYPVIAACILAAGASLPTGSLAQLQHSLGLGVADLQHQPAAVAHRIVILAHQHAVKVQAVRAAVQRYGRLPGGLGH